MSKLVKRSAIALALIALLLVSYAIQAQNLQATSLILTSPAGCPPSGCAAGQSVDLRASFDLGAYDAAQSPNVQVCFYTPVDWAIQDWYIDLIGGITGESYQSDVANCPVLSSNYEVNGVSARHTDSFGDVLNLRFRIAPTATTQNGSVVIRILERSASGWSQTDQTFVSIPVVATNTSVYAANDAVSCGDFSPCFINSGSDLENGIGTGLKDAVDAQPETITILGYYQVKNQTVVIDQPVTIQGLDDSRITYVGSSCANPVLRVTVGAALRELTITDGSCTSPNRDLVIVDSSQAVSLEYVDLLNGLDAVKIADNTGDVSLRFSQALNNSGYAVFRAPGSAGGTLMVSGSNLYSNRTGIQVDCAQAGMADHNFWGFGVASSSATSQCAINDFKQLGAPILPLDGSAGVSGEKVTVTGAKNSSFGGLISYQRTGSGSDYELNIVNHGAGSPENVPFTGGSTSSMVACSNYYDVYLEKDVSTIGTLNLSLRYDRTAGCTSTIETTAYCTSTDSSSFPLYWYSPYQTAPSGWNTTGATGQETTCDTTTNEISVAIDTSGRPDFSTDLNFTPFGVGLPSQPSSIVLTRLVALSGDKQATIQWTTSSEVNTSGFYVLRSTVQNGSFERVSGFINRKGSSSSGADYEYIDTGLTNNVTYYYRLEIISASLESSFSQVVSVLTGQATSTITLTPTVTRTITPTFMTSTSTVTRTRTPTITRIPTRTRTPIRYATYYLYKSPTSGPSRTQFPSRTSTNTLTPNTTQSTATARAMRTILSQETGTPDFTFLPPESRTMTAAIGDQGSGYPVGTPSAGGTAISQRSPLPSASVTPFSSAEPGTTLTPSTPAFMNRAINITQRYRPWLLGLLGFELIILLIVGYWLYKNHLLAFNDSHHKGEPPKEMD